MIPRRLGTSLILTEKRASTFRLDAESCPFESCKKIITVYDHDSEAIEAMISSSEKRGAQAKAAEFPWPRLRIHSSKLRGMITRKRLSSKKKGFFVFQLRSRVTGARYFYQMMKVAQEHGWHVLLDACTVGPNHPYFLICSFYKIFGENQFGFGCLFVSKSAVPILESSVTAGIVSVVSARKLFYFHLPEESSGTENVIEHEPELGSSSSKFKPGSNTGPSINNGEGGVLNISEEKWR